jgi:hypothetical protein
MRIALVMSVVALLSSCGGSGPTSAGPSTATLPLIAGTYLGPTTVTSTSPQQQLSLWTIRFTRAGDSRLLFRSCSGTLVLEQSGSNFTGSFTQSDDLCPAVSGVVTAGDVRADGGVTFSLAGPGSDPLAWTSFAGCTMLVPGTMGFTGTVSHGLLDASFVRDAVMECPGQGTVWLNVRLRGSR